MRWSLTLVKFSLCVHVYQCLTISSFSLRIHIVHLLHCRKKASIHSAGNVDLMHECFPKHSHMGTATMKLKKKQTEKVRRDVSEYGKKQSGHERKKKSRRPKLSLSKYTINKHNLLVFYNRWKKYNESQLTNNKMDLNNRQMIILGKLVEV